MHRLRFTEEKILDFRGVPVRLQKKRIKSLRLRLIPPHGEIRLSVPHWYSDRKAEEFLHSRWQWVMEQKRVIHSVHPLARQRYTEGEEILFRGSCYRLKIHHGRRSSAAIEGEEILLTMASPASSDEARRIMENWYRKELKKCIGPLVDIWSPKMNVPLPEWRVRRMNSRWGSCNTRDIRINLNLELITMKPEILEYVVVHELAHLLEASHNKRFKSILDSFLPQWRILAGELKSGQSGDMSL